MNSSYETRVFHVQTKGKRYGFTLAGEYPCQLVKIQPDSAAERAGLESGDEVIEVNGVNVEGLQHDNVVNFISPTKTGLTDLRIRRVVKTPGSPFQQIVQSGKDVHKSTSEDVLCPPVSKIVDRVVEEFKRPPTAITPSPRLRRGLDPSMFNDNDIATDEELRLSFSPEKTNPNISAVGNISTPLKPSKRLNFTTSSLHRTRKQSKIQVVLGYLGSIDRPMTTSGTSNLVTHLRVKREPYVIVLLEISAMGVCLRNSNEQILMTCPTDSLAFVGICPENKPVLGLFTTNVNTQGRGTVGATQGTVTSDLNLNCTCHLFLIDPRLIRHRDHELLTDRFRLRCTPDPATGSCQQFPTSSVAILNAISAFLKGSSTQIATNGSENYRGPTASEFQVERLNPPEHVRDELCGKGPSGRTNFSTQAGQYGSEQELVLCLQLHPLVHTGMTKGHEMDSQPQGDFSTGRNGISLATMLQNPTSKSFIPTTETVTSSNCHDHTQVSNISSQGKQTDESVRKDSKKPLDQGKEIELGHKTFIYQRSQSLASNVKTTSQTCSPVEATESNSQKDFHVGCGGRPIFHSSSVSVTTCSNLNSVEGKVAKWAVAFDRLLEDSTGVNVFKTFLQKEYSEENMIFWLACEKYRTIEDENELIRSAEDIYETHLKSSAAMPVNVESSAIREVEEKLKRPTNELFATVQYQVYTLMKFDSYPRFLKSELYRQCWVAQMEGIPLPLQQESKNGGYRALKKMFSSNSKVRSWKGLKSQHSFEIDETKKKFAFPWRVRFKSDQLQKTSSRGSDSQASSTRSSLSSLSDSVFSSNVTNSNETVNECDGRDQAPPSSCRVILPNHSLMYLFCKNTHSLKEALSKLCEKNNFSLPALDLFIANRRLTKRDLQKKLTRYINKEIVLKQGVLFRLQLPNGKVVGIKANGEQAIDKVLEPILSQYGLDISDVALHLIDNKQLLNTSWLVSSLHQKHVIVEERSENKVRRATDNYVEKSENNDEALLNNNRINSAKSKEASLFDDIMNGKRQSISGFSFDENGVFVPLIKQAKSEESLLNSKEKQHLLRSPGFFRKKKTEVSPSISTFQSFVVEEEKKSVEELYTLLHRSQRSRIEDQRGVLDTKIELPDFLKQPKKPDKGNNLQDGGVAKPFHRHPPLIKSTSSPPACEPSDNLPEKFPASSVHVQPSPRDNTMSRNWSGSSIMQGKPHVTQVVNQTQTIDRRRFFKTMQDSSSITRLRAGSLPEDNPGGRYDEFSAASERRARSRYQYGSESSFGNKENQVVWVSNALHKNRRREPNKTDHSGGPGNKTQTGNDWNSNCVKAEVIIPQMKSNTSRFSPPRGVRNGERPKPIRDNSFVREYLQTTEPRTSTPDDQSKAHPLESASDREAILDNSFLRTQLKPSRLFSQTSPETNTPLGSSSPAQKRNQRIEDPKKCPIFYSGDSGQDDTITEPSPESPVKLDSARQVYWGLSELGNEEEAVKVTFV